MASCVTCQLASQHCRWRLCWLPKPLCDLEC